MWRRVSGGVGEWGGHLNAGDDNMFAPACIDYVTSLANFHTTTSLLLFLLALVSSSHSLFYLVHFSSLSVSVSHPALSFPLVVTLA